MIRRLGALTIAVAITAPACAPAAADRCVVSTGGTAGQQVQLRSVELGATWVAFSFGLRSGERGFGIPAHTVRPSPERSVISFDGVHRTNPDGTPSYPGEGRVDAGALGIASDIRAVSLGGAPGTVEAAVDAAGCPRVLSKSYAFATTLPRSVVFLAYGDGPVFTLEPTAAVVGKALQVMGLGFSGSSAVTFSIGGRTTWESTSRADGSLDTALFLPDLPAGRHDVVARDASGRTARGWATILPRP